MGEFVDKVKGKTNELVGEAKQALAGDGADQNAKLKAEGEAQEAKGKAQQATGAVKGALGNDI